MPAIMDEQISALRRLADDLERIRAGAAPTPGDLADAPLLDPWFVTVIGAPVLAGEVTGHPRLGDRPCIRTTPIYVIDSHGCWARTASRFYRLGRPVGSTGGRQ